MQQERLRVLGQMASGIAHDINNALSPAALYVQSLLERDKSWASRHANTSRSYSARSTMSAIPSHGCACSTVARTRTDARSDRSQRASAAGYGADARPLERHAAGARIVIDLKRDITPTCHSDGAENEIRDALTNLVSMRWMPCLMAARSRYAHSWPSGTGRRDVNPSDVCLWSLRHGLGMTKRCEAAALSPFSRPKVSAAPVRLAMVYGMVQRHSADFEIESAPARGRRYASSSGAASQELRSPRLRPRADAAAHPARG